MERDFTYIDDIVKGMNKIIQSEPTKDEAWSGINPNPSRSKVPYRVYNIGNNRPVKLLDFIEAIEKATGKKAIKKLMSIQPGDVVKTWADVTDLKDDFEFTPKTSIKHGITNFIKWYRKYNSFT